jgi:hypothetical protein
MAQGEMALTQAVTGTAGGPAGMFTDPKVTNPPFTSHSTHVVPTDANVQRGYMRLLGQVLQANLGVVPSTPQGQAAQRALDELGAKLDFQFNPNELVRSVTARTDTQLWINQSPSELLTPGLGDMSFQWQMLFNREEEVQRYYNAYGRWSQAGYHAEGANSPTLDALLDNPAEPMVAERIGVLADIMVMDQITGQRLTEAAIAFSEKWALVRDEDGNVNPEEPISADRQESLLSANLTNSAFLIPNPIRVVFSENFMVDGYVNKVAVSIQKFSPDMVPTVCTVDISMHALYQGFARRSTVFTTLANMQDDEGPVGGGHPLEHESLNAEATVVGSTEETLQVVGLKGTPVFAGLDHSPQEHGRFAGDRGSAKMDSWKAQAGVVYTDNQPLLDTTILHAPKGGRSLKAQNSDSGKNAFTFNIVSNLADSNLGSFIRENGKTGEAIEWFKSIKPNLQVVGYVGLQLRARLKADDQNSLEKLWTDGDENGFENYSKASQNFTNNKWEAATIHDDHFFDRWSKEQRRMLFAAGIDTFQHGWTNGNLNDAMFVAFAEQTEAQNSGHFTRSFPILEVDPEEYPGYYGDQFYKKRFEYGPATIDFDIGNDAAEGWIWGGTKDTHKTILSEEWHGNIANGFYDVNNAVPFPDELVLTGIGGTPDETYTVQYQQNLTLRVRVSIKDSDPSASNSNGYLPISDTGVLIIYPRTEATGIINDVDKVGLTKFGVSSAQDLDGDLRGVYGSGINADMKDWKWIEAHGGAAQGLDKDLFYDGLFQHEGTDGFVENMKQYGLAYDRTLPAHPSLSGVMISSVDTLIGTQPVEFIQGP